MSMFKSEMCSICGTTEDALDNLTGAQLLINQCGHKFCKTCIDRKFSQKSNFACPVPLCGRPVRKNTISEKTLDEIEAADDAKVRRRVNDIYNKVESDFELLRDFNDYQEAKEDAIFALVHNIDRPAVEAQLQAYQRKHVDEIRTRLAARDERDRQLGALLGAQQRDSRERVLQAQARDVLERKVEREARRQDLQIRMGERTVLSDELVARQQELAALKNYSSSSSTGTGATDSSSRGQEKQKQKRPLSQFMAASASGLGGQGEAQAQGETPSSAAATGAPPPPAPPVPSVAQQLLQQRPLPKFLPSLVPPVTGPPSPPGEQEQEARRREEGRHRRAAGGFDPMTIFRRNYWETLGQLQLLASSTCSSGGGEGGAGGGSSSTTSSSSSRVSAVCWPWPFDSKITASY